MTALPLIIAFSAWHIVLWTALAATFVGSLVVLRTKWAQQRPFWRCVLLSLAAHAVLIAFAALVRFAAMPPGSGPDKPVRITIVASSPTETIESPEQEASVEEVIEQQTEPEQVVESETDTDEQPTESVVETKSTSETQPKELESPDLLPLPKESSDSQTPVTEATLENSEPVEQIQPVEESSPLPSSSESQRTEPKQPEPQQAPVTPESPALPASLAARSESYRMRSIVEQGGSPETEQAVALALEWLAGSQSSDGRWDVDRWRGGREFRVLGHDRRGAGAQADNGITGLAVLTFLGAGHTHLEGAYQHHVAGGLAYLIRSQRADGSLAGNASLYARTYCHSMATFALAEAYALTKDKRLKDSVTRAVDYLLRTENKAHGGWRYEPNTKGDVSQLGWIIMALRSAELAGVKVPQETWQRIESFLGQVVRGRNGGLAAYQSRTNWSRSMTAEAMYCRQVIGKPLAGVAQLEALDALAAELPGDGLTNYYYWYYATLAIHHAQHDNSSAEHVWKQWNDRMKRELLRAQATEGALQGSWSPNTVWGGYGGRVYTTAMAAMCLEVYYRYDANPKDQSPWVAGRPRSEASRR